MKKNYTSLIVLFIFFIFSFTLQAAEGPSKIVDEAVSLMGKMGDHITEKFSGVKKDSLKIRYAEICRPDLKKPLILSWETHTKSGSNKEQINYTLSDIPKDGTYTFQLPEHFLSNAEKNNVTVTTEILSGEKFVCKFIPGKIVVIAPKEIYTLKRTAECICQ